jgi:hypothetical protein
MKQNQAVRRPQLCSVQEDGQVAHTRATAADQMGLAKTHKHRTNTPGVVICGHGKLNPSAASQ